MDKTARRFTSLMRLLLIALLGTASLFLAAVPSAVQASTLSWTDAPASANLTPADDDLYGVSCFSDVYCVAVGQYYISSGGSDTLAEVWNGTSWSDSAQPGNPSTASPVTNILQSVSCVSTTYCLAVGYYVNGSSVDDTLAEVWNGTSWSDATEPINPFTSKNALYGVSCFSTTYCVAVGGYTNNSGVQVTLGEVWNGTAWADSALPANPSTQINVLESVSCVSATYCVAVGNSWNSGVGYYATLAEVWNGASWSDATLPGNKVTTANGNNYLYSISCFSTTYCVAVGEYSTSNTTPYSTLAEVWSGAAWTDTALPVNPSATGDQLWGVSCVSTTYCVAAGYYENGDLEDALGEVWNGASWSDATEPANPSTSDNYLQSISCMSTTYCVAGGNYFDTSDNYDPVGEVWNGSSWSDAAEPGTLGSISGNDYLSSVTCVTSSDCWAVGYTNPSGLSVDLDIIEQWNGSSWSVVGSPSPSPVQNFLEDVTCFSATDCWATGNYDVNGCIPDDCGIEQPLIEQYNGTTWSAVTSPTSTFVDGGTLFGITCLTASNCWSVGDWNPGTPYISETLTENWNGTSWAVVTSPNPTTTNDNVLEDVACVTASDCWAVGQYIDASSEWQTIAQQYNGTSWSTVASANKGTDSNYLYSITCISSSNCYAAGDYYTGSYYQTLIEQYTTSWATVTSANESTTENNYLQSVTCTSASNCLAVGDFLTSGGDTDTFAEVWNGTAWTAAPEPVNPITTYNELNGVSCVSATDCVAVGYYENGSSVDQTLAEQYIELCTGGGLYLTAPASAAFPGIALDGVNETSSDALTFTPDDETGTGDGWNIAITSTTLTNAASDTLPTTATTVTGVASVVADAGNCSLPTNTTSAYPYTIPAAASPPTAISVYSANTGTGEGPAAITLNFALAVPADSFAGSYTATWTVTLSSGP